MTPLQKDIIEKLLLGYTIAGNQNFGYRLRSPEVQVCRKFYHPTFDGIKDLLRKQKNVFVIDKRQVRKLRGNTWAKKQYKKTASTVVPAEA